MMEPLTIGLIILNLISFFLHGLNFKYSCGDDDCTCRGECNDTERRKKSEISRTNIASLTS